MRGEKYLVLILEEIFLCQVLLQQQSNAMKQDQEGLSFVGETLRGLKVGRLRSDTTVPIRASDSVTGGCGCKWGSLTVFSLIHYILPACTDHLQG